MSDKLTKLEFYKLAKTYFSKHKVGKVKSGTFPLALCRFVDINDSNLSNRNCNSILLAINKAKIKTWENKSSEYLMNYNSAYFPTDSDRMKFINSEINRLTKK